MLMVGFKALALGGGAAALIALDHIYPQAGLIALLVLVGSLGSVHGALDVMLLARCAQRSLVAWGWASAYLLSSLLTAWVLRDQAAAALLILLGLSVWHFGEGFEAWCGLPAVQRAACRWVRGGAPVLIPALIAKPALQALVLGAVAQDSLRSQWVWAVWSGSALLWLGGVCVWLVLSYIMPFWRQQAVLRHPILLELAVLALLYAVASPLMAFALFFGLHHATGHIRRVTSLSPALMHNQRWFGDWRVIAALALTLGLGALLVMAMPAQLASVWTPSAALRSVVLALTAVSVPHVVLVHYAAPRLPS
jgi:beta-carotene 15,15'-dioxygenase